MNTEINITPSLPANSWEEIDNLGQSLNGAVEYLQIDIVDGRFTPHISWPFTEPEPDVELAKLKDLSKNFSLEIDCMILAPEKYLEEIININAKRVIIHYGSSDKVRDISERARDAGLEIGLGITNDTSIDVITDHFEYLDFVQLMGIKEIGQQGQPFDERTIENTIQIKSIYPNLPIAIDGAVNSLTIPALVKAGANRLAPGSAITKAKDKLQIYRELKALANNSTE